MPKQLLHIVIGGDLVDTQSVEFRDLTQLHYVGAYPNYAEALIAWRGAAQSTVDNAIRRYFILHAHKLIDPNATEVEPEKVKRYRVYQEVQYGLRSFDWQELDVENPRDSGELYVSFVDASNAAIDYMKSEFETPDDFALEWEPTKDDFLGQGWTARAEETDSVDETTFFIAEVEV